MSTICKRCGGAMGDGDRFCAKCGFPRDVPVRVQPAGPDGGAARGEAEAFCPGRGAAAREAERKQRICPACGRELEPDRLFCPGCGTNVSKVLEGGGGLGNGL